MKPELLLPAGNIESFYAALEGGADAIYFGLQDFNARRRAKNFSIAQLPAMVSLAKKKNVKLYVALNIVLKNEELPAIYLILHGILKAGIDAVIIQDLGIFYLIKKYFPKLKVHASTQMAIHNSIGVNYANKLGIKRTVLARELTWKELTEIKNKAKAELEVFVHGALCYSFSGLCLFSSYLGGMSANRGACKQPCRRLYTHEDEQKYLFSLKDNELIDLIPKLSELGINSLKVEGRLKSAEYVYNIAQAYRAVLDNSSSVKEARQLLKRDISREKTSYFLGGKQNDSLSQMPNTGMFIGYIEDKNDQTFTFSSFVPANEIEKIRICSPDGQVQESINLTEPVTDKNKITVPLGEFRAEINDLVYVIGFNSRKFSSKLPNVKPEDTARPSYNVIKSKVSNLIKFKQAHHPSLYLRIDSLSWIRSLKFENIDYLILNLPFKEWGQIPINSKVLRSNAPKLIAELPKFISEENCDNYKKLIQQLFKLGIENFMVSHISQIELLPTKATWHSNENVYVFNDAAAAQLEQTGIKKHIFPLENDFKNLMRGSNRAGIVPIYFYPQLFYSRMPVKLENSQQSFFDENLEFRVVKRNGMTITIPAVPTSLFSEKYRLIQKGFKNFLVDLSFEQASPKKFDEIFSQYKSAGKIKASSSFNFKSELK